MLLKGMSKEPAKWRAVMTPAERRELQRAIEKKDNASQQYYAVLLRLKNRCIQRLRRMKE